MDNNNIVTYFFFYDDDSAGSYTFGGGDAVPAAEQAFIEGIVNKFEHHKNLIWAVKEEYAEAYSAARVSNIAAIIRAADDNNHVISVHQNDGISFNFANDPNIDQFAIQRNASGASNIHNDMVSAWSLAAGRYNLNMSESNQHYNPTSPDRQATRRYSWAAAMGGSYVMILRDDIISTPTEILEDHGRIVEFFEETNFNTMRPYDYFKAGGTEYVMADTTSHSFIAYADDLVGNIGLRNMVAGDYDFLWFDTVTGAKERRYAVPVSTGIQYWFKPLGIGDDLAVWITPSTADPIPGDANRDGVVDDKDATILAANWLATGKTWEQGDFNGDWVVDEKDASLLAGNWGNSYASAASVPEPGVLALLAGILLMVVLKYRKT
jgi:hypothetical protein